MKRRYFLLFLVLSSCVSFAQTERDSITLLGRVMDSFTYEMLKGVRMEILRSDSSTFHEEYIEDIYNGYGFPHNVQVFNCPRTDLILRFSMGGYITQCINLSKGDIGRREKQLNFGDVLLVKKRKSREVQLGEAMVTTSKIRMVVKGDTLIYDADAFQLAEGSMLDGLIKMLPGFELRDGRIRVNGQYVSELLVNGENFFKGDPRVALENLPAYMVNKVKVYRKEHEYSYITQEKNKEELPLVVDVNLKREYSVGWVANAGVGYGLEDRYMARLFGLGFTDYSRLAVYGNANNTNDMGEPGVSGEWNPQGAASGLTEMQKGGLEALIKDRQHIWKYTGNIKILHQDNDDRSVTSTETFQPGLSSNTYARSRNERLGHNFRIQSSHQYEYKKAGGFVKLEGSGAYQHRKNTVEYLGAEFSADPKDAYRAASLDSIFFYPSDRLTAMLVNSRRDRTKDNADVWNGHINMNGFVSVPKTPDYINIAAGVNVERQKNYYFSDYNLHYGQASMGGLSDDNRHRYAFSPSLSINAHARISYTYCPDWAHICAYYEITERYCDSDRSYYRLDRLGNDAPDFGELPSTTAALMSCLDAPNTYTSRVNTLTNKVGTDWHIWIPGKLPSHRIQLKPEVEWRTDHLKYHRDALNTRPGRSEWAFTPSASWGFEDCYITYTLNHSYPDLISLLDYTDTADPLNLVKGNPDLKRSTTHKVNLQRSFNDYKKDRSVRITGNWWKTHNAISHAMTYDEATGVRTYMPRNVEGNWGADFSTDYKQPLGKKRQIILYSNTLANYRNCVDYVSELSTVRNLTLSENLRLNLRIKKCIFDVNVGMKYLHAASEQESFNTINGFDLKYGLSAQIPLPGGLALSADATLYHRTGYTDNSMNGCNFVANARLSKTFLNGRLGLTLDAFDIFHGIDNIMRVVNAQGVTETWHNSLPSYAMLQIVYKFSKQPKKK